MTADEVNKLLRKKGYRLTRQRKVIVDVIFSRKFENCKDIYTEVVSRDSNIGLATVYRTIRQLEDLDVLNRVESIETR
ncbi:MAG: transcriptional repressor [Catonella sp.]|jgi:Fur family ferric uptake transcriptional regulator|nr:transcriptional repressor [Catonella sp.]MDY6357204.1 transcriptional repressor [Catonella sp.]